MGSSVVSTPPAIYRLSYKHVASSRFRGAKKDRPKDREATMDRIQREVENVEAAVRALSATVNEEQDKKSRDSGGDRDASISDAV